MKSALLNSARELLNHPRMLDQIGSRLEHYMDLLSTREKLVASNIANADTPGYKTRDIDFQFEYMSLPPGGTPTVVEPEGLVTRNDGNNVNMDSQARMLAETALRFSLASNLMKAQLQMVRTAIQSGSGS